MSLFAERKGKRDERRGEKRREGIVEEFVVCPTLRGREFCVIFICIHGELITVSTEEASHLRLSAPSLMLLLYFLHADYETVTPEGDDEEKGDANTLQNNENGENYPESGDYLYEEDEEREREEEQGMERDRDPGSDEECDPSTADRQEWEEEDQEGSGDDGTYC